MGAMIFLDTPDAASGWCESQRNLGLSIGMVPTMGALHDGHAELVRRAVRENDLCVVSIFVNPLQFNEARDFQAYPRDIEADRQILDSNGCAMAFTGTLTDFFPGASTPEDIDLLEPGPFARGLEGEHRQGHFAGVRTIVDRLFRTVHPSRAYFGEKDFQQTLVVKDLATSLGFPEIVVCPTVREPDGLAMSSRNRRLGPDDRLEAAIIYRALTAAHQAWREGERRAGKLAEIMRETLARSRLQIEYAEVRDPGHWNETPAMDILEQGQALVAVRCGEVRLIDTLELSAPPGTPTVSNP
jgi:pantoate--beta-alanine ligase